MMAADEMPVALVTGAGSGIGQEIARALRANGVVCVLVGRRLHALDETAAGDPNTLRISGDLCDSSFAEACVDQAAAWRMRLDIVVNNAGDSPSATIAETTTRMIEHVFALNAVAPAVIIARAWPWLVAAAAKQVTAFDTTTAGLQRAGPCVINISSMATLDPFPQLFAYAAAKASVNLMAQSVAQQGTFKQPSGSALTGVGRIRGFAIAPGAVETQLLRRVVSELELPREKTLAASAVAAEVLACVRGQRDAANGTTIFMPSPA